MAELVLGIGCSHTPLLTLTAEQWQHRAAADYANKELNLSDGRLLPYEAVLAEFGPRAKDVISLEILNAKERACSQALDRLADELERLVANDLVEVRHQICPSATVALSSAVLVPRTRAEKIRAQLIRAEQDVRILVNGPWPPYTFGNVV